MEDNNNNNNQNNPFKFTAQQLSDIVLTRNSNLIKEYGGLKGIAEALKVDINIGLPNSTVENNGTNPFADREAVFGRNGPPETKSAFLNFLTLFKKNDDSKKVNALRGGESVMISNYDVQVGDVVFLKQGDVICADGIIIQGQNLKIDESSATGEPTPVEKGEGKDQFIISGTTVSEGVGNFLVTAVGSNSFTGFKIYI
ncbi:hypothetical protein PIROE2DRAFT_62508 [Piromyces sp. E2]|nr:hypothetical protein PIROE2DRAFT_62508 [Piromyces sp. E2]|eukprot:OUM61413.1 hypothetical protein PIROE2DRAFT_62508 [Piromyces sp. E2]